MEDVRPDVCPKCFGLGLGFRPRRDDLREEIPCPTCGGSGLFSDALAFVLSGEKPQPPEPKRIPGCYYG